MKNIIIREMQLDERDIVYKVGKNAFVGVERLWVGKPNDALVAVMDDKIVGAILYNYLKVGDKKIGYVDFAFVDKNHHNMGIGNILYKGATEYLWENGCDALSAVVKDENIGSNSLFLKNGFERVSMFEVQKYFGTLGVIKQYFGTPLCFGVGMEYYLALKGGTNKESKIGSSKQIFSYIFVASLLLLLPAMLRLEPQRIALIYSVYISILLLWVFTEFITLKFTTNRKWMYRLNNGGGLVGFFMNCGTTFPLVGNWYPDKYDKTKKLTRDLGIVSLSSWILLLGINFFIFFYGNDSNIFAAIKQISLQLLAYHSIPFYPFESFGGRRVYKWNKIMYFFMLGLSMVLVIETYM